MTDHPGESQLWANHHGAWSKAPAQLYHALSEAFTALHEIQFSAPWKDQEKPCKSL